MLNEDGKLVDLYVPRKCSATNRLVGPQDHASVQLNIANVNEEGLAEHTNVTVCLSGELRSRGQSDASLNRLLYERGILSFSK